MNKIPYPAGQNVNAVSSVPWCSAAAPGSTVLLRCREAKSCRAAAAASCSADSTPVESISVGSPEALELRMPRGFGESYARKAKQGFQHRRRGHTNLKTLMKIFGALHKCQTKELQTLCKKYPSKEGVPQRKREYSGS